MAADVELAHDASTAPLRPKTSDIKLSRYRSVRKAQSAQLRAQQEEAPPLPVPPPIPESSQIPESMKRSMSRYRRGQQPVRQKTETASTGSETPRQAKSSPREARSPREEHYKHHAKGPHPYPEYPSDARKPRGLMALKDEDDDDVPLGTLMEQQARRKEQRAHHNTEGKDVLATEKARYERIKAQQRAERAERDKKLDAERRKREEAEEAIRKLEREKVAEEERERKAREAEKERAVQEKLEAKQRAKEEKEQEKQERALRKRRPTNVTVPSQKDSDRRHSSSRGSNDSPESKRIGGFFRRRKEEETPRTSTHTDDRRPKTSHASPPKFELPTIRPGGGGIVPLDDAPVSGMLSADRHVKVVFKNSQSVVPVDLTTSAQQLIKSAAPGMYPDKFNPRSAIVHEYFGHLRRPVRMYENVRAIMNSWADDDENYFRIEEIEAEDHPELYESNAPQQHQVKDFEGYMQCEWKKGKFDSRWVIVRNDGQITAAKNEKGKDVTNVCNLSDFDVYTKHKKPGKFYVKSQQKRAMFMDEADFQHKFETGDKRLADEFFRTVQSWRSSYLVNKVGQSNLQATEGATAGHVRSKSAESQYLLGTFNDLGLDFSSFAKPPDPDSLPKQPKKSFEVDRPLGAFGLTLPSAQEHSKMMHARQLSVRKDRSRAPPLAMRHGIPSRPGGREDALQALNANAPVRQSSESNRSADGAFNPGGLLGSQYEQRRHNAKPSQDHGNSGGLQRNTSVRSTRSARRNSFDSATIGRRDSVRRPGQAPELDFGKPLLDFTPQYKEPPQFAKRGKAVRPENLGARGLIDHATSNDNPLGLPGTEDWKARPKTSGAVGLDRSKSINRTRSTRRPGHGAISEESDAFTGGGLLANSRNGFGDSNTGHGVMSGNQARGPMLNMNDPSMFGSGTLLRKMENENLGNPKDREPWRIT